MNEKNIFVIAQITSNRKYNRELDNYIKKLQDGKANVFVPDLDLDKGIPSKKYYDEMLKAMQASTEVHSFFLTESTEVGVMVGMAHALGRIIHQSIPLQSTLIQSLSNYIIELNNN